MTACVIPEPPILDCPHSVVEPCDGPPEDRLGRARTYYVCEECGEVLWVDGALHRSLL